MIESERIMTATGQLSIRRTPGNDNHHLWNNNGTWWCHYTVHLPDFTKERLRLSLGTVDVRHARRLRDSLFARYAGAVPVPVPVRVKEVAS